MIYTEFFGWVTLEFWEYLVGFFYLVMLFLFFSRHQRLQLPKNPEYKYFVSGLMAKIGAGIVCAWVYFYRYGNGDSISFFYSALPMANLATADPVSFFHIMIHGADQESWWLFDKDTGSPLWYVFFNTRTFLLVRLISPLVLLSMKSFIVTSILIAAVSYTGVWKCYQTFFRYYPSLRKELAIAVLFMPSCIFWGSTILKDTLTFSALCLWIYGVDQFVFVKRNKLKPFLILLVSSYLMVGMKPYIFMVIMPMSVLWALYSRITAIRNTLIKYLVIPVGVVAFMGFSFFALNSMGSSFDKFSLDNSLNTILISQADLKRSESYGSNFHDIGTMDGTWGSVLSKFPKATNAALFRPYLVESKNVVMLLSGLENTWLLGLFLVALYRTRVMGFFQSIVKNPLVMVCLVFAVIYGFVIGISTPNFGALVRFRIPLLPLFVSGMYIILFLEEERKRARREGRMFRWEDYHGGQPDKAEVLAKLRRER